MVVLAVALQSFGFSFPIRAFFCGFRASWLSYTPRTLMSIKTFNVFRIFFRQAFRSYFECYNTNWNSSLFCLSWFMHTDTNELIRMYNAWLSSALSCDQGWRYHEHRFVRGYFPLANWQLHSIVSFCVPLAIMVFWGCDVNAEECPKGWCPKRRA